MGKYGTSSRRPPPPPRDRIPPLVRGIGCLLFVLVPIVGYGIGAVAVNYGRSHGWPIPPQWLGAPRISAPAQPIPLISDFLDLVLKQDNLIANLVFAAIITVLLYGVMTILFGYVYSVSAPSKYGPMDVPPPRVKTKKYKR